MPATKLKAFLDSNHVEYRVVPHAIAYTAQEVADSAHISGDEVAKTVIVNVDGKMAMAVLPASYYLVSSRLRDAIGARDVVIAGENEFADHFPGCEIGAMPPFGNLYDMPVFVDQTLVEDEQIAFNAGSHAELIQLPYKDFERLVKPQVLDFAAHRPDG
jgi:Ala-tRNA(Pro) deacylase